LKNGAVQDLLDRLKLSNTGTVYFYDQLSKWKPILTSDTAKKLELIRPTAFYIFNHQPYILFFDLTDSLFKREFEIEIHKKVWSFDQSPLAFILKDGDIEIYNAFSYEKKKQKLQQIKLDDEQLNRMFSFWNLQSGKVWEWIRDEYYKNTIKQKRVSQKLFDNIKVVREKLVGSQNLTDNEANTLILRLIFIRYLIDRNVKLPTEFIQGEGVNQRRLSFIELIGKPEILNNLFAELNNKFNGVLFKDIQFELSKEQAVALAGVFSGEVAEQGSLFFGSDFFFDIFDFSIIPVELISGIYESLIDPETRKLQSAVYTPSFLVEYMLTETVDDYFSRQNSSIAPVTECKIFDPAVGSGIFLVQAYRRMVEREIEKEKKISKVRLREIVVNNLFGIDINEQALKVTCFSIYIAMLDYIDPASILVSFKFPDLIGSNLFKADFFDTDHPYNEKIKIENVSFLIGNPPWKSDKNDYHVNWLKTNNKTIGRYEIAQSFLLRSKDFMSTDTTSALIVTSTIFYNVSTPTKKFKAEFLTNFCINSFFDLSPVRRLVFEEKDNPCSIVFYRLSDGSNHLSNILKHQSIKSNIFLKYFKTLVIEKFDQKRILQKSFLENDWMFKVALYGGSLDFRLMLELKQLKNTINDIVNDKNFYTGDGIYRGTPKRYYDFLIGKPVVETDEICPFFTNVENDTYKLQKKDVFLESGRQEKLFDGEVLLLKHRTHNESDIVVSFTNKPVVFRHGVYGITTKNITNDLKLIFALFISRFFTYYQFLTSSSWGVGTRPEIKLEEYLSLPIPDISQASKTTILNAVNDILFYFNEWYKDFKLGSPSIDPRNLNSLNNEIEKCYKISAYKKDIIDYVLRVSRYQFQENKQHQTIRKVHNDESTLSEYANVFVDELGGFYENEYLRIDVYPLDHFIAINFVFENEEPQKKINFVKDISDESTIFKILSENLSVFKKTKDLYIQKDVKGFEENSFYIIKPNEYKCWHRAMAWYDLAEIKEAIETAEIDHLKQE